MNGESRPSSRSGAPTKRPRRRALPLGIISFLGAAFVVAAVNGPQGLPFVALLLAMAFVLIIIVTYVAFGGSRDSVRQAGLEEFGLQRERRRSVITERVRENWKAVSQAVPRVLPLGTALSHTAPGDPRADRPTTHDEPRLLVEKYVRSIVPVPRLPRNSFSPQARQDAVEALREEARGLIRLAKITGIEIEPYREFVVDARQAAVVGRIDESLHSIALANEILRASVEKSFMKHMQTGREELGVVDA
jgi:hypothetical protein